MLSVRLRLSRRAEQKQLVHIVFHVLHLLKNRPESPLGHVFRQIAFQKHARLALYGSKRIAQIMGHHPGKFTQGSPSFCLDFLLVKTPCLFQKICLLQILQFKVPEQPLFITQ